MIDPGTEITDLGLIARCCTAAANVIAFCTEPGSKADITGGFIGVSASMVFGSAELNVLEAAIVSTCPLCASSTTSSASFAPDSRTAWSR